MVFTRKAQHRIIEKWDTLDKSSKEYIAFIEGMEAVFVFMEKYKKDEADFYANRLV
tara:strand:- start:24 stop:191 length:168 start_codon:yes stop_codon:yes gene_type:complete